MMIECCEIYVRRLSPTMCQEANRPFAYRLSSLPSVLGAMPINRRITQRRMLGLPCSNPLAPHLKRTTLHLAAHQTYHRGLVKPELPLDCIKRGSVLPRHFYDAGDVLRT